MRRAILLLAVFWSTGAAAANSQSSLSELISTAESYLDMRSLSDSDRDALLHPEMIHARIDGGSKPSIQTRDEVLREAGKAIVGGKLDSLQRVTESAHGFGLRFPDDARGWVLLSGDAPGPRVVFSLYSEASDGDSDGLFDTGERTDTVREVVGKFYLHAATANVGELQSLLQRGWQEYYRDDSGNGWQARDRDHFLSYLEGRDGITRIAYGKRIAAMDFMRHDLVRVTVRTASEINEILFLLADGDSWSVAFYLH